MAKYTQALKEIAEHLYAAKMGVINLVENEEVSLIPQKCSPLLNMLQESQYYLAKMAEDMGYKNPNEDL